jgi:ADP-heptose:LPS heptosyltransferase
MRNDGSGKPAGNLSVPREEERFPWINPTGGLGDILMLSGVLKLVKEKFPARHFNLVRRSRYQSILRNHPAIRVIGSPPRGAVIIGTDYWSKEKLGSGNQRAFQIIARSFGLPTPVEENLYLPGEIDHDDLLLRYLPIKPGKNILIAPYSDSPRKMMPLGSWRLLIEILRKDGYFVMQAGQPDELPLQGAYSLLGLTTPQQLVALLSKCDAVITVDNFVMHCSHLSQTPAVVLWGPTDPEVYGYAGQIHLGPLKNHCGLKDQCLGPEYPANYATVCPVGVDHCLNKIQVDEIIHSLSSIMTPKFSGKKS